MKSVKQAGDIYNKHVMMRVDFNVPVVNGEVQDDTRIRTALPTLVYLIESGAKTILTTHLGRPGGKVVDELKLDPVAKRASEILEKEIKKVDGLVGEEVESVVNEMKPGDVIMLENTRFSRDEKNNQGTLANDLSKLADIFVQESFAVAHRASASNVGVPQYLPSFAGLLLEKEMKELTEVLEKPAHPFVVLLGGAKIETKIPVLQNLIKHADKVLVGGALVNTFLQAKGFEICDSLVDPDYGEQALEYMEQENVITPVDWIVGVKDGSTSRVATINDPLKEICKPSEAIYDIGPETIKKYKDEIGNAKLIVWNGAMGLFEQAPYEKGTNEIADAISKASKDGAHTVIGGGETILSVGNLGLLDSISHVSTGGGAMLEVLAGNELPGVKVLG